MQFDRNLSVSTTFSPLMKRTAAMFLIAVLAAAIPSGGPQAASTACARQGGDTLMNNRLVRVYEKGLDRVYACNRRTGRRFFLTNRGLDADGEDEESFIAPRLAGRFIAFGDSFGCDRYGDCGGIVRVVDTRDGADVHVGGVTVFRGTPNSNRTPTLAALRLKKNGSAAFIIGPGPTDAWEVQRMDRHGNQRLDGGDVDPRSLATSETRIYWMKGGIAASASFD